MFVANLRFKKEMGKENFIKEALHNPTDYVSYHVGRELAELYPGRVILEGETWYFDLEAFVRAEKCSIVNESSLFDQLKTVWDGPDQDLIRTIENSWLNVLWRGNLLD